MTSDRIFVEPPVSLWDELLESGLKRRSEITFRQELLQVAQEHTASLEQTAKGVGIDLLARNHGFAGTDPIVMSGHQATIFHPGILQKVRQLQEFAKQSDAAAIFVTLDLDYEAGAELFFPKRKSNAALSLSRVSLATEEKLTSDQRLKSSEELAQIFDDISSSLMDCGIEPKERFFKARNYYLALAGRELAIANTIVRRALEGDDYLLEISLSRILKMERVQRWIIEQLSEPEEFFLRYNDTLKAFRRDQKIKNRANPFPDLREDEARRELPFWIVKGGKRKPLYIEKGGEKRILLEDKEGLLLNDIKSTFTHELQIVPKGALITMLFRSLCADLFIHGIGGGKYDRFTDRFAREELAPYVVVSATNSLFPELTQAIRRSEQRLEKLHKMRSHIEHYLDQQFFSPAQREKLSGLSAEQHDLLEKIRQTKGGHRSQLAHRLNQIKREIARELQGAIGAEWEEQHAALKDQQEVILFREFPYFLFSQ